jgi:hypothetical protein
MWVYCSTLYFRHLRYDIIMIVLDLDESLDNLGTKARKLDSYTSLRMNMIRTRSYRLRLKSNLKLHRTKEDYIPVGKEYH